MSKNYKDITLKVFDEVFKDDCYYRDRYSIDTPMLVKVFGWKFFWWGVTDDAFILYDTYLDVQHSLEYSDTYEDDLRKLLLDHIIPDTISELKIHDALKMYAVLKNKGLVEFINSNVSIIPNTKFYYKWAYHYLVVECVDYKLRQIYGKNPFPNMRFNYGDIDDVILYVESISKFLTDNKEVIDSYIRLNDSINQLVEDLRDDVQYKLNDGIEDIIKLDGRG